MGFLFGAGTGETAESLAARRAMADALLKNGSDMSNIRSPMEGFGKLLQQLGGKLEQGRIASEGAKHNGELVAALMGQPYNPPKEEPGILGNLFGPSSGNKQNASPSWGGASSGPGLNMSSSDMPSAPSGNPSYRDAIANIESKGSGDYSAVGPTDAKMGRALGRYQIMEANIGPWSKEVLGREVTPQEFMANPQLQDAIFDGKFGQYVNQFGPEGAAQAWFGGPGSVGKGDRKDVLGTTVAEYGDRFMAGLGGGQEPAAFAAQPGMAATASPALGYAEQPAAPPLPAPIDVATRQVMPDMSMRHGGDAPPTLDPQQGILRAMNGFSGPEPGASGPFPPAPGMETQAQNFAPGSRVAAAMAAMSDPYADAGTKQLASVLLQQEFAQQQAQRELQLKQADPAYQMGLEKDRLELARLRNPPQVRVLTPEEKKQMGLPANLPFQMKPDGSIAQIGNAGTTVNVDNGSIPPGYRANRDEAGRIISIEPIPGSKDANEAANSQKQRDAVSSSKQTFSDVITSAANRASDAYENKDGYLPTGGLLGKAAALLPGSNAAEVRRQVNVLKSNAKIENLNAMRQQSPTGGALGNVTQQESDMLAAKVGALDPESPNFGRDLEDYERTLLRVIHGNEAGDSIFEQSRQKPSEAPKGKEPVVINGYKIEEVE